MGANSERAIMQTSSENQHTIKSKSTPSTTRKHPTALHDRTNNNPTSPLSAVFSPDGTLSIVSPDTAIIMELKRALREALEENKLLVNTVDGKTRREEEMAKELSELRVMRLLYEAQRGDPIDAAVECNVDYNVSSSVSVET